MLMVIYKGENIVAYRCGKAVVSAPIETVKSDNGKFTLRGFYDHNGKWHTLSRK